MHHAHDCLKGLRQVALIHPTAIVDAKAQIDSSVAIGAYTVVGPHVRMATGTTVGPHCVIEGHTTIGRDNRIFQFASLGAVPQDKKYAGEPCELVIGDRNTIREFSTYNIGSPGGGGVTRVGNDNWLMAYVHLAHDCAVGNNTIFANNTQLAGHVEVGDWVILGGFTVVHQFVRIGAHGMTAMCSLLFGDLPPFERLTLHYIRGALHITILLPLAAFRDSAAAQAARARMQQAVAGDPQIAVLEVHFY